MTELDWWEERELRLGGNQEGAGEREGEGRLRVVCTPCQHVRRARRVALLLRSSLNVPPDSQFTGRSLTDRNDTLWASWAISSSTGGKVWFGGASLVPLSLFPRRSCNAQSLKERLRPRRRHRLPHGPPRPSRPGDPARLSRVQPHRRARGPVRPRHDPHRGLRPAVALLERALRAGGLGGTAPRDEVQEVDRCVLLTGRLLSGLLRDRATRLTGAWSCRTGMHWATWQLTPEEVRPPPRLLSPSPSLS